MKADKEKIKNSRLKVRFYKNDRGNEPVKAWLKGLRKEIKNAIGKDIMTVQFGWPIGMPVVKAMSGYKKLWEVRTNFKDGTARVLFTIHEDFMVLLHGFIKKDRQTPDKDIKIAEKRKKSFLIKQ